MKSQESIANSKKTLDFDYLCSQAIAWEHFLLSAESEILPLPPLSPFLKLVFMFQIPTLYR